MSKGDLEARVDKFVFRVRQGYGYTREGLWVRREDERCRIGIGDYLQQKNGDVAIVELPEVGLQLEAGDVLLTIETMKTSFDVLSPVSGQVVAVNSELDEYPEHINEDPYGAGWLADIECSAPPVLLDASAYFETMSKQATEEAATLGR